VEQGASTTVYCTVWPNLAGGQYYCDCAVEPKVNSLMTDTLADQLWVRSEALLHEHAPTVAALIGLAPAATTDATSSSSAGVGASVASSASPGSAPALTAVVDQAAPVPAPLVAPVAVSGPAMREGPVVQLS